MFTQIASLNDAQIEDLLQMYQSAWWSQGRQKNDIQKMLNHSDEIIAFCDPNTNRLVAFSRILTDYVYRALVFDVIVAPVDRGQGLGRLLVESIINHPPLQNLEQIALICRPEMLPFYQKWGFQDCINDVRLMKRLILSQN